MTKIDLSTEVLLVRRELAEKATPGPWRHPGRSLVVSMTSEDERIICDAKKAADAAYIAANDPPTVISTIDELLRLRAELEQYKDGILSLQCVARKILADYNFYKKENISLKKELLRLQEDNARLERKVD